MSHVSPSPADDAVLDGELFCPACGYDLQCIGSERCPECGKEVDRRTLAVSRIPWVHRREIGRVRAFWKTVWWVTSKPQDVARECARPVSLADAKRFRWTVSIVAWVPVVVAAAAWRFAWLAPIWREGRPPWVEPLARLVGPELGWGYYSLVPVGSHAISLIALLLWLAVAGGVASYFFHPGALPRLRQERAVALSYYAAAPLALLPVVQVCFVALTLFAAKTGWNFATLYAASEKFRIFWLGACAATFAIALLWWVGTLRLLRGTTQATTARLIVTGASLPGLWLLLAPLIYFFLHAVVGFILLLILYW